MPDLPELIAAARAGSTRATGKLLSLVESPRRDEVVEALLGLGFTARPAEAAVDGALEGAPDADASTLLRTALNTLSRTR